MPTSDKISTDLSLERPWWFYIGPAFLVSVGYMDPGNWATSIEAGSLYGYALLWVITLSSAIAFSAPPRSLRAPLQVTFSRPLPFWVIPLAHLTFNPQRTNNLKNLPLVQRRAKTAATPIAGVNLRPPYLTPWRSRCVPISAKPRRTT